MGGLIVYTDNLKDPQAFYDELERIADSSMADALKTSILAIIIMNLILAVFSILLPKNNFTLTTRFLQSKSYLACAHQFYNSVT